MLAPRSERLRLGNSVMPILESEVAKRDQPSRDTLDKVFALARLSQRDIRSEVGSESIIAMLDEGRTAFLSQILLSKCCDSSESGSNEVSSLLVLVVWAIFGWSTAPGSRSEDAVVTLRCDTCGRSIARNLAELSSFDFIREHRYFCPWISSTKGKLAGWEVCSGAVCGTETASLTGDRNVDICGEGKDGSGGAGGYHQCFSHVIRMIVDNSEK